MQYSLYSLYAITFVALLIVFYILLYSVIFVLRAQFASQTPGLCSAIPSALVRLLHACLYFALFSIFFCFACFASQISSLCNPLPSAPVVCYTLLLLVIYVSCSLPHQHRAYAVLFPSAALKLTPFCFSSPLFYSVYFCYACFTQQAPVCAVIFPGSPRICTLNSLLCIVQF